MQDAIKKSEVLIEALPYIKKFFKKSIVIKFGGNSLDDAKSRGVEVVYPSINKSKEHYSIQDEKIYAGFLSIEGVGLKTAEKIHNNAPYTGYEDFKKRARVSAKILKGLIVADAFRSFNIEKKKEYYKLDKKIAEGEFEDIELTKLIYVHTTLKPKLDITKTFPFRDYEYSKISDLDEKLGGKQVIIRGLITDSVNKDKLLRPNLKDHVHQFEMHMFYLNLNDGSGDIALQVSPYTYELYSKQLENIKKKAVVALGSLTADGKKMYLDLLEIVGETTDIKVYHEKAKEGITLASAAPNVSKKGKSYYRLRFSNGVEGLLFNPRKKLFPGMRCKYRMTQSPFCEIRLVK